MLTNMINGLEVHKILNTMDSNGTLFTFKDQRLSKVYI